MCIKNKNLAYLAVLTFFLQCKLKKQTSQTSIQNYAKKIIKENDIPTCIYKKKWIILWTTISLGCLLTVKFSERFIRKVSLILPIQVPLDTLLPPPSSVCGGNLYLFMYSSRGQPLYTTLKRLRCKLLFLLPGDRSNKLLRIRFLKFSSTHSFLQVTSFFQQF